MASEHVVVIGFVLWHLATLFHLWCCNSIFSSRERYFWSALHLIPALGPPLYMEYYFMTSRKRLRCNDEITYPISEADSGDETDQRQR